MTPVGCDRYGVRPLRAADAISFWFFGRLVANVQAQLVALDVGPAAQDIGHLARDGGLVLALLGRQRGQPAEKRLGQILLAAHHVVPAGAVVGDLRVLDLLGVDVLQSGPGQELIALLQSPDGAQRASAVVAQCPAGLLRRAHRLDDSLCLVGALRQLAVNLYAGGHGQHLDVALVIPDGRIGVAVARACRDGAGWREDALLVDGVGLVERVAGRLVVARVGDGAAFGGLHKPILNSPGHADFHRPPLGLSQHAKLLVVAVHGPSLVADIALADGGHGHAADLGVLVGLVLVEHQRMGLDTLLLAHVLPLHQLGGLGLGQLGGVGQHLIQRI